MNRLRTTTLDPEYIMERWWPGSQDYYQETYTEPRQAWDEEYSAISSRPHFARLMEWMRGLFSPGEVGGVYHSTPAIERITLGSDGRVHDGHHRILAAYILGWDSVVVEFAGEGPWWEEHVSR